MIDQPTNPPNLEHLFSAACDESLTADDRKALESALANDTGTQDAYLAYCRLHANMRMHMQSRRSIASALLKVIEGEKELSAVSSQPSATAEVHVSPRSKSWLNWASRHPKWPSIAVALLVMVGLLGWAAVTYVPEQVAGGGNKSTNERRQAAEPQASDPTGPAW